MRTIPLRMKTKTLSEGSFDKLGGGRIEETGEKSMEDSVKLRVLGYMEGKNARCFEGKTGSED